MGKRVKKLWKFALPVAAILFLSSLSYNNAVEDPFGRSVKVYFSIHNDKMITEILQFFEVVKKNNYKPDSAKIFLSNARVHYKYIEAFVKYYMPGDARILNNPIINELEEDDEVGAMVVPHGFQYLEQMLYSDSVMFFQERIKEEAEEIYALVSRFNESMSYMEYKPRDVFEAFQMENVRQFMLGFANFETAESRTGVPESAATLAGMKEFIHAAYPVPPDSIIPIYKSLYGKIDNAIAFLSAVKPDSEPDYFTYYSQHYIPVSEALGYVRHVTVTDNNYKTSAINYEIRSVFDAGAFNSFYFLPAKELASHWAVIDLGRLLFFDPAMSANNLRACASCHQADKAFTDGLAQSEAFEPGKKLARNAPTVINAVLQRKLFHDGRAFTFEDQAGQVMSNPLEMHNDFSQVAQKLRRSPEYVELFRKAFAGTEDTFITNRSVLTAVAEYERSMVGLNSRFDKTVSGRAMLMTPDEIEGFNIYMGKGNCASCHFIPLFNGVMPPEYTETEWEILGVPAAKIAAKRQLDSDIGRAAVVNVNIFMHAFKVPTLRNVELTGPYMHNGVFQTLEEVVEFYDAGGGKGLGYDVPFQTLSPDSLHLTPIEKSQLIAFMKTLTDTVGLTSMPGRLPSFPNDPNLDSRPIGGDY